MNIRTMSPQASYRLRRFFTKFTGALIPLRRLFRKKSRWQQLCPCKRGHYASAALQHFAGASAVHGRFLESYNSTQVFYLAKCRYEHPYQTCGRQFATAGFFFILKLCACACSGYLFRQHVPCQKESIVWQPSTPSDLYVTI